jgi:hypothetical protein
MLSLRNTGKGALLKIAAQPLAAPSYEKLSPEMLRLSRSAVNLALAPASDMPGRGHGDQSRSHQPDTPGVVAPIASR